MGAISSYKDLIVWQKSMKLANEIYRLTEDFPEKEKFGITSQLRRSVVSVPSNIAEGWGRNSSGSYVQFLRIANGSLCEVETQLILSQQLGFCEGKKLNEEFGLIVEISKMLKALIDKVKITNQRIA